MVAETMPGSSETRRRHVTVAATVGAGALLVVPELADRDREIADAKSNTRAEFRRQALRDALERGGIKIAEASRRAGLKQSGTISNFLRGVSDSLNLNTLEPLARVLGVSVSELIGDQDVHRLEGRLTAIRGTVRAGAWRRGYCLPEGEWQKIVAPRALPDFGGKSYFLTMEGSEMDQIYPYGTILEVVDLADFRQLVETGNRIIITRTNQEGYVETSVREVVLGGDGHGNACQLVTRSTVPEHQDRIVPWPWPIVPGHIEQAPNGDQIMIRAVVVRATRHEVSVTQR